jgi:UDP-3-O-[3-hydroxymyristoyl] N-acetylglucosamine deacetylase / 3-hydroxyacyl-[acyl-carrier-protein] dehydratase
MTARRTIRRSVSLEGIGLQLGQPCRLTMHPAATGTGIRFRRTDLEPAPAIPAHADAAVLTERRTQLGADRSALHTVEHVLAAVTGACIDDLEIGMDASEPPIADGSAEPFLRMIHEAGIIEHGGSADVLTLQAPVRVEDGDSVYEAYPSDQLEIEVSIDFPHPLIGRQSGRWTVTPEGFARELAGARTFGFVREVEQLRARGLIKGATTQNAVVLDDHGVVESELRWPDEFVRHKAMDLIGDLALAGARVQARVVASRPSHRGTVLLVRAMQAAGEVRRSNGGASAVRAGATGAAGLAARTDHVRAMDATNGGSGAKLMGIEEIMRVLPHRYPFLLVDRIVELEPGKRVVGIKNVTINEPFFQGHFPGHPIMPGVLIIEAMAQVGGMLLLGAVPNPEDKVVYFTSLNDVKWRQPVKPGDQLRFELDLLQVRGMMCKMRGVAKVDGKAVAEAEMGAVVRDK